MYILKSHLSLLVDIYTYFSEKSELAAESSSVPTSVIASVPTTEASEEEESAGDTAELEPEAESKEASCTVADLIEEEEEKEEEPEVTSQEEAMEEDKVENKGEENENEKVEEKAVSEKDEKENSDEKRSQASENMTAAELAYEWDDEGVEEEKPKTKKETPKKSGKSAAVLKAEAEVTPGRKSSRTPKLTQKMLESQSQKNLKDPEPEESGDDEDEESVDAIAKELEKSDSSDSKKSPKGGKASPKKGGKKPVMEGEKSKEEWVNLIFGENGEKVTEGGKKKGEEKDAKEAKEDDGDGEDFVPETDTPKAKRGGRPKKKGLDETCEGVGKLGSNMYFYDGGPYLDSDEEDDRIKDKKADSEPARKSSRANKGENLVSQLFSIQEVVQLCNILPGQNKRLERADEVVAIPQVKVRSCQFQHESL